MKRKLNIIFLDFDDILNPLLGAGQARATVEVGGRLAKKGHRVTVISSKFPGYKDRKENGITYTHIGVGTNNIRLNNIFYIILLPFTVIRLKADLIFECFTAPVSTLFSPLFTRIPVVGIPTSFEAERFAKLYHFPFDVIQNFGLRFYKYFLPFTKHFEHKMKKRNKDVITKIVPEGVGDEFFRIKKQSPKHILFLGRLDMGQKGLDLLLAAYSRVARQMKYPLVIAGAGPDEKKVMNMVKRLRIGHKVKFVGPVYGAEKHELLSQSLFVAFSSRHEGFSLFSLEALASGLPLLSFNIPGLEWADDSVCVKVKPFSVEEYSKKLLSLSQSNDVNKMSRDSRRFAKQYTWNNVADEYEDFATNIVAKKI